MLLSNCRLSNVGHFSLRLCIGACLHAGDALAQDDHNDNDGNKISIVLKFGAEGLK
jgi:hypothetical protein